MSGNVRIEEDYFIQKTGTSFFPSLRQQRIPKFSVIIFSFLVVLWVCVFCVSTVAHFNFELPQAAPI